MEEYLSQIIIMIDLVMISQTHGLLRVRTTPHGIDLKTHSQCQSRWQIHLTGVCLRRAGTVSFHTSEDVFLVEPIGIEPMT
jgi:hypothetical protein